MYAVISLLVGIYSPMAGIPSGSLGGTCVPCAPRFLEFVATLAGSVGAGGAVYAGLRQPLNVPSRRAVITEMKSPDIIVEDHWFGREIYVFGRASDENWHRIPVDDVRVVDNRYQVLADSEWLALNESEYDRPSLWKRIDGSSVTIQPEQWESGNTIFDDLNQADSVSIWDWAGDEKIGVHVGDKRISIDHISVEGDRLYAHKDGGVVPLPEGTILYDSDSKRLFPKTPEEKAADIERGAELQRRAWRDMTHNVGGADVDPDMAQAGRSQYEDFVIDEGGKRVRKAGRSLYGPEAIFSRVRIPISAPGWLGKYSRQINTGLQTKEAHDTIGTIREAATPPDEEDGWDGFDDDESATGGK